MYITRLASNEIFSPSNKIRREVGRAKGLISTPVFRPSDSSTYAKLCIIYVYVLICW